MHPRPCRRDARCRMSRGRSSPRRPRPSGSALLPSPRTAASRMQPDGLHAEAVLTELAERDDLLGECARDVRGLPGQVARRQAAAAGRARARARAARARQLRARRARDHLPSAARTDGLREGHAAIACGRRGDPARDDARKAAGVPHLAEGDALPHGGEAARVRPAQPLAPRGRPRRQLRAAGPRARVRHAGQRAARGSSSATVCAYAGRSTGSTPGTATRSSPTTRAAARGYPVARWEQDHRMQAALYMLAVRELRGLEPAGGVYLPLADRKDGPRGPGARRGGGRVGRRRCGQRPARSRRGPGRARARTRAGARDRRADPRR